MPRSPRRRIRFATVTSRIEDVPAPGWADPSPQGVASATDARTTRFCRTLQRRTSCTPLVTHEVQLTLRRSLRARRCRVHHIPPRVRDDRDTPLLPRRDSAEIATDLGAMESDISLQGWLDDPNQFESVQQIRFCAQWAFWLNPCRSEVECGRLPSMGDTGFGLMTSTGNGTWRRIKLSCDHDHMDRWTPGAL